MPLLSANSTLRTILILLILWQVLRIAAKVMANRRPAPPTAGGARRPKGDMRIEQVEPPPRPVAPPQVEDADFEEVK